MVTTLMHALYGSHEETQELMSAYHEGELSGYRRWRVMRHLAKCEVCRELYDSVVAMLGGLRELGRREPPPDPTIADRVVERLRQTEEDGRT